MQTKVEKNGTVAIIGAGPAGIYAAKILANAGVQVALINRDIRPGGLAEYGIYHDKYKMKSGLRKQFKKVLAHPNIHYFGNITVSTEHPFKLEMLHQIGFDAVLVTVGAQGTKWLDMEGESLTGVYHAKELVYHYNSLPSFSEQDYKIGKRIAIVGVGNVMVDIARWAIRDLHVDEVIAIARRGAADVKFTKKEMQSVAKNLDFQALDTEMDR
ncbi:MAG: FAD-dependent oxidoreductase, partial [Chloroflexota bacterium]